MEWHQAQSKIKSTLVVGTNLNTHRSKYRYVKAIDTKIKSNRYGYEQENGFVVSIGVSTEIMIPWSMLKECFFSLLDDKGYDGVFFRKHFPRQSHDHPCHVHVIGQMFVVSGIAETDGKRYLISSDYK